MKKNFIKLSLIIFTAFLITNSFNNIAIAVYLKKPFFGTTIDNSIKLEWNDSSEDPGFYIEISKSNERDALGYFKKDVVFKSFNFSKENEGYSTSIFLASGDYYWHVKVLYGNGTSEWNWDGVGFFHVKTETSLSLSTRKNENNVELYGSLDNPHGYLMTDKSIEIQKIVYSTKEGYPPVPITLATIKTNIFGYYSGSGYFSYKFQPIKKNNYRAIFKGDNGFQDSFSEIITVKPYQQFTKLTLFAKPKKIYKGKAITIKGQLEESNGKGIANKKIVIRENSKKIRTLTTNSSGGFSLKRKPKKNSSYKASFAGDTNYKASSSNVAKVKVKQKKKTKKKS